MRTAFLRRPALALILLLGFFAVSGCSSKELVVWEKFSNERLAEAAKAGQPAIVYFYAAWCGPCHYLKDKTFSDPQVATALEPFVRLKADMSFSHSEKVEKLAAQFSVQGLPTVAVFNRAGIETGRFSGFIPPERFMRFISGIAEPSEEVR